MYKYIKHSIAIFIIKSITLLSLSVSLLLQPTIVLANNKGNEVKIIVNGIPISSYDINNRIALFRVEGYTGKNIEKDARESLIEQVIKQAAVIKSGLDTPNEMLAEAISNITKPSGMSIAQFKTFLEGKNVSFQHFVDSISISIGWERLIGKIMHEKNLLSPEETVSYLKSHKPDIKPVTAYELKSLAFFIPADSSEKDIQNRYKEIAEFTKNFKGCTNVSKQIAKYDNVISNNLGLKYIDEFPENYQTIINNTKVGGVSAPVRTMNGLEVFLLCNKKDIKNDSVITYAIANEKLKNTTQQDFIKEHLEQLNLLKSKAIIIDV